MLPPCQPKMASSSDGRAVVRRPGRASLAKSMSRFPEDTSSVAGLTKHRAKALLNQRLPVRAADESQVSRRACFQRARQHRQDRKRHGHRPL